VTADRWLERPQSRLRWRIDGPDYAPEGSLLLVHGWALDLSVFELVAGHLRDRLRVLRFDRRGYGASTGEPALEADVEDAFALLDAAGIDRCAVLGMSQGARVVGAMARRAPGRITHVILDGAPALRGLADEEHEPELPLEEFRRLARTNPARLREALAHHPLLRLAHPSPAASAILDATLAAYPATDLLTVHAPAPPAPSLLHPAAFAQPSLVLNGERDSAARLRIGRRLAQALPHAQRRVLPGAGHLACLDHPQAYALAVLDFLRTAHTA
jgi:pimeloyl-ACP methyl ester carboxylesterase